MNNLKKIIDQFSFMILLILVVYNLLNRNILFFLVGLIVFSSIVDKYKDHRIFNVYGFIGFLLSLIFIYYYVKLPIIYLVGYVIFYLFVSIINMKKNNSSTSS